MEQLIQPERRVLDVSREFLEKNIAEFGEFLMTKEVREYKELEIVLDLSNQNKDDFVEIARKAKAFIESETPGQRRSASIKCLAEQKRWEPNVFASGVEWKKG